ncbi:MAG: GNAT family N-acetyltransferase [Flavobacteriales bacterium]|jgi:ElaA protein|nr:GNAT family N-acetyltransferase [Flavobacteriales bacterium]
MTITWTAKGFGSLTTRDLHDLLRLRIDVFVVEQRCAYAEADGRDPMAIHILGRSPEGDLAAYARLLPPEDDGMPRVGRVIVRQDLRGRGIAHDLMREVLSALSAAHGSRRSKLSAQAPLQDFYSKHGYRAASAAYDWDGIPHVDMVRHED